MYITDATATIDDADGPISGPLTDQGDTVLFEGAQPDAYIGHTITLTVIDGGDAFTATDMQQSKLGSCSFAFSGSRTSIDAPNQASTTTIASTTSTITPAIAGCDSTSVLAVITTAHPGAQAEMLACEGGWAVVSWWLHDDLGDRKAVLRLENATWRISSTVCPSVELPASIHLYACETQ